jgi:hypothetical protein
MRRVALSMLMIAGLTLSSCALGQSGTLVDASEVTPGIVGIALDDLVKRPVLEYEGAIDNLTGTGEPATITVDTAESGTSYGTATIGDHEVTLLSVDGVYYVNAPKDFWTDQGVDKAHAKKIAGEWTQVDPGTWFDPGAKLTARQYADALEAAIKDAGVLNEALPEPVDFNGTQAYPLPVDKGIVYISVAEPHAVLGVVDVGIEIDGDSVDVTVQVAGIDADRVEELYEDIGKAVDDLGTIYDNGADLELSESGGDFDCDNSSFKCSISVEVTPSLAGEYHVADKVKVTFKAEADGGALGTKKCDDSDTVDIGDTAKLKCTVNFSVPADGVSYNIYPDWTVTGEATFTPDTDEIAKKLDDDVEAILKKLK